MIIIEGPRTKESLLYAEKWIPVIILGFLHRQNPNSVSVDDIMVRASNIAPCYGHWLPIVSALSISFDGHFSRVTEPATERGEGPLKLVRTLLNNHVLGTSSAAIFLSNDHSLYEPIYLG